MRIHIVIAHLLQQTVTLRLVSQIYIVVLSIKISLTLQNPK